MPINRFFLEDPLRPHTKQLLLGEELHHLYRVVRLRAGEEIELVNGQGAFAVGRLVAVDPRQAIVEILSASHSPPPSSPFTLAIPYLRPSKLEWIIEKGTELGASHFTLFAADRSEKRELPARHIERNRQIAVAALKQSGRLHLPGFTYAPHLEEAIRSADTLLFGDLRPGSPPLLTLLPRSRCLFVTGPEGGFSEAEEALLRQRGTGVRLSPHVLRAETAPIAAASLLGSLSFS
jgi:16S rRNA (uracil1498-N3)-methyltransferase